MDYHRIHLVGGILCWRFALQRPRDEGIGGDGMNVTETEASELIEAHREVS